MTSSMPSSPSSTLPLRKQILSEPDKLIPQTQSYLFILPPEVRSQIFTYALTDYPDPDPSEAYSKDTCYTRPSFTAPRRSDVALLRTCRAVYQECWSLPFFLREQVHWAVGDAAGHERAPPPYEFDEALERLKRTLQVIKGQHQQRSFEIRSLRIFAPPYEIARGRFRRLISLPELNPRVVTLTIRHTDWWFFEEDLPLGFGGEWTREFSLSASVRELRIEFESLERKKYQVDGFANQMMKKWHFQRTDGVLLYAHTKTESRWRGSSTWHGKRHVKEETSEGVIDYYIATVTFLPESVLEAEGRHVSCGPEPPEECTLRDYLMLYKPDWKAVSSEKRFIQER